MKVVFFGTSGAVPSAADGNVAFAVAGGGVALLVDVSGTPIGRLLRAGLDPLALRAVLVTHGHPDHVYAFPSLLHGLWLMERRERLLAAGPPEALARARALCDVFGLLERPGLFPIDWQEVTDGPVEIGRVTVRFFPVEHSPGTPTCGLVIAADGRKVVYSADTRPTGRLIDHARGAALLVHEASAGSAAETALNARGHSSARQAGEAAQKSGAARLFLCHLDHAAGVDATHLVREARRAFRGPVAVPRAYRWYEV